jgi:hypothetical protein
MNRLLTNASRAGAVEKLENRALLTVPQLSSLPGAPVTVYLDFDGHVESETLWNTQFNNGNDITIPAFDSDGDVSDDFSETEIQQITEIWARVAEDFSPFTVNVTTVEPDAIRDYETVNVVIGGDSFLEGAGGVAFRNAFSNSAPNTVFTFADALGGGSATHNLATTSSHEAGHAFGLRHHSLYDANGNFVEEYHPGFGEYGPILGAAFTVEERDTWYDGPANNGFDDIQADMEFLTRASNRTFDFREDDHGDSRSTATVPELLDGGAIDLPDNIITTHDDQDFFEIETAAGTIEFTATVADVDSARSRGNNLDVVLNLYNSNGNLLASAAPDDSYDAFIELDVAEGTYYLEATSIDLYGSAGQYDITGRVIPLPGDPVILSPIGETADATPRFSWVRLANTRSYELQVNNTDTGQENVIRVAGITNTDYTHDVALAEGNYEVQVRQLNQQGNLSEWSPLVDFTVDLERPGTTVVESPRGITEPTPQFSWQPVEGAASYILNVRNVETDATAILRNGITGTSYVHFRPLGPGSYATSVTAVNEAGELGVPSRELPFVIEDDDSQNGGDKPVVLSPRNNSTQRILRPLFTYEPVAGAIDYEVRVTNLSTNEVVISKDGINGTRFKPSRKLSQGTYKVEVRADLGFNEKTEFSDAHIFTIDIQTPADLEVISPSDTTVGTQNPTFTFTPSRRAKRYRIIVTDGDEQVLFKTINRTHEYTSPVKLPESDDLTVFIAGINSVGEIGEFAQSSFAIEIGTPAKPTVTGPERTIAGIVSDGTPTITFTPVANAVSYILKVRDLTTGEVVIKENSLKQTTFTSDTELEDGHQYRITVVARNSAGERSRVSDNYDFTMQRALPTTPVIFGPTGDITTEFPTATWQNVAGAFRFRLFVKELNTGSTERYTFRNWDVSEDGQVASFQLPDRQRAGVYQMSVQAINSAGGKSGISSPVTYTVVTSAAEVVLPEGLLLPDNQMPLIDTNDTVEPMADVTAVEQIMVKATSIVEAPTAQTPPEVVAQDPAASAFADADWWTGNLTDSEATEQSVEEADSDAAGDMVAAAAGVFAVPLLAAKLLKRVRSREKKQK